MINGEETLPNLRAIITTDLTSKAGEFLCLSVTKHNKFQKQTKYMEKRKNEKFYFFMFNTYLHKIFVSTDQQVLGYLIKSARIKPERSVNNSLMAKKNIFPH